MAYYNYLNKQYRLSHEFSGSTYTKESMSNAFETIIPDGFWLSRRDFINGDISAISHEINASFREKILTTKLKPMAFYYDRMLTYYDKTENIHDLNEAIINQQPYDASSFVLLYRFFDYNHYPMILSVVIALIFGANYASDFEKGEQLAFVYTQPLSKKRYYGVKYLSGLMSILKLVGVIVLGILAYGLIFDPKHTLSYPVLKYMGVAGDLNLDDFSSYYSFITIGEYLVKALSMTLMGSIFLYSMLQLLSSFIHSRAVIYAIAVVVGAILYFALLIFPEYAGYNPIIYLNPAGVVNGSLAVRYGFLGVEFFKGIVMLSSLSLLSFVLGRQMMNSKIYVSKH